MIESWFPYARALPNTEIRYKPFKFKQILSFTRLTACSSRIIYSNLVWCVLRTSLAMVKTLFKEPFLFCRVWREKKSYEMSVQCHFTFENINLWINKPWQSHIYKFIFIHIIYFWNAVWAHKLWIWIFLSFAVHWRRLKHLNNVREISI